MEDTLQVQHIDHLNQPMEQQHGLKQLGIMFQVIISYIFICMGILAIVQAQPKFRKKGVSLFLDCFPSRYLSMYRYANSV